MIFALRPSCTRPAIRKLLCSKLQETLVRMRSKTVKTVIVSAVLALGGGALWLLGQETKNPVFRTKVDLVVLSFTVTDNKGHYINNLKPAEFRILEDGIVEKISTFAEGNKPPVQVNDDGTVRPLLASGGGEGSKPG